MDRTGQPALDAVREAHRAGRLAEALKGYRALLAVTPDDPDLIGLLGVLALQQGRLGDAEAHLRRSLALDGDARIHVRNLNNLVVLLREDRRGADALALLETEEPRWPDGAPADEGERAGVLSLIEALIGYGQPAKARRLLDEALPGRDADAAALNLDGRLLLEEGDAAAAAMVLERASALAPGDCQPLIALSCARHRLGEADAAREVARQAAVACAVHAAPALASHKASILVLNPYLRTIVDPRAGPRGLHFATNYASQAATLMQDEFRFLSVFADLPADLLAQPLPRADIVLNNIVNAEPLNVPGRLEALRDLADRTGLPVINHPDQVHQTTRQKNPLLLQDIPNLRIPRIARYQAGLADAATIAADIEERFDFPVILRIIDAHQSSNSLLREDNRLAVLLRGPSELQQHLDRCGWPEFYVVEFVDLRRPNGFYRQQRAVVVDGDLIVIRSSMFSDWMVTSWRSKAEGIAFYRANPQVVDECNRIVMEPERYLGAAAMETLRAIGERVPLDMFGIDFDVDAEGRVVFFEAGAGMIFHPMAREREPEDISLPREPLDRVDEAFRRMILRRLESVSVRSGSAGPR